MGEMLTELSEFLFEERAEDTTYNPPIVVVVSIYMLK